MTMNKQTLQPLKAEILAALAEVAKRHNVSFRFNGGTFDTAGSFATLKLDVACVGENGVVETSDRIRFRNSCEMIGLKPTDLDRQFLYSGRTYRVAGLTPTLGKLPVVCADASGKLMRFSLSIVQAAMS